MFSPGLLITPERNRPSRSWLMQNSPRIAWCLDVLTVYDGELEPGGQTSSLENQVDRQGFCNSSGTNTHEQLQHHDLLVHCFSNWGLRVVKRLLISSHSPSSQPLDTTNLLSVFMDLPILDISYKWNPTICGRFHLASST